MYGISRPVTYRARALSYNPAFGRSDKHHVESKIGSYVAQHGVYAETLCDYDISTLCNNMKDWWWLEEGITLLGWERAKTPQFFIVFAIVVFILIGVFF